MNRKNTFNLSIGLILIINIITNTFHLILTLLKIRDILFQMTAKTF